MFSYVIYKDVDSAYNKATVQKFNGTNWVLVGTTNGFTARAVTSTSIAINSNNIPFVAYTSGGAFAKYFGPAVLGVNESVFDSSEIVIYPNPVKNILNISNVEGEYSIEIFDLMGKLLYSNVQYQ